MHRTAAEAAGGARPRWAFASATDRAREIYVIHFITRQSQWLPVAYYDMAPALYINIFIKERVSWRSFPSFAFEVVSMPRSTRFESCLHVHVSYMCAHAASDGIGGIRIAAAAECRSRSSDLCDRISFFYMACAGVTRCSPRYSLTKINTDFGEEVRVVFRLHFQEICEKMEKSDFRTTWAVDLPVPVLPT